MEIFQVFIAVIFTFFSINLKAADKTNEDKKEILVSAAASLKNVFVELSKEFEAKNNVLVLFNFAASGQLKQQIEAGASVDVFAAAAQADMDELIGKKLINIHSKINFAKNQLVIAQNINTKTELQTPKDLSKTDVKKISIGSIGTVPAGMYAKEALSTFEVYGALKDKMVFGENVRQVLDYVSKNEVDAGIVYMSDAQSDKNVRIAYIFPENTHRPILYPIAVVSASKNEKSAKDFITFITSKSAQKIFKKHGFR